MQNQWWLHEQYEEKIEYSSLTSDSLWSIYESLNRKDSIVFYWDRYNQTSKVIAFLRSIGFHSGEEFSKFISDNSIPLALKEEQSDLEKLKQSLQEKIERIDSSRIKSQSQLEISLLVIFMLGVILYVLRPFVFAIKWSIKAVKTEGEN